MMRFFLVLWLFPLVSLSSWGQCALESYGWSKTFGQQVNHERIYNVVEDNDGNLIIAGVGNPDVVDPTVIGNLTHDKNSFVQKLDPATGDVLYTTRLGDMQAISAVVIDSSNNVHLFYQTQEPDLPTSKDALDPTPNGGIEIYHIQLEETGKFVYGSYYGGSTSDRVNDAVIDDDTIYVVGSTEGDFPVTAGVIGPTYAGESEGFIFSITPEKTIGFSTYLGGTSDDSMTTIKKHGSTLFVAGLSWGSDFPVTGNAHQSTHGGRMDGILALLSDDATSLLYATYYGGSENERYDQVTVNPDGSFMAGGVTTSSDLPLNSPYDVTYAGDGDAFLTGFNSDGTNRFGTYLTGSSVTSENLLGIFPYGDRFVISYINLEVFIDTVTFGFNMAYVDMDGVFSCDLSIYNGTQRIERLHVTDDAAYVFGYRDEEHSLDGDAFIGKTNVGCHASRTIGEVLESWQDTGILSLVNYVNNACL